MSQGPYASRRQRPKSAQELNAQIAGAKQTLEERKQAIQWVGFIDGSYGTSYLHRLCNMPDALGAPAFQISTATNPAYYCCTLEHQHLLVPSVNASMTSFLLWMYNLTVFNFPNCFRSSDFTSPKDLQR